MLAGEQVVLGVGAKSAQVDLDTDIEPAGSAGG